MGPQLLSGVVNKKPRLRQQPLVTWQRKSVALAAAANVSCLPCMFWQQLQHSFDWGALPWSTAAPHFSAVKVLATAAQFWPLWDTAAAHLFVSQEQNNWRLQSQKYDNGCLQRFLGRQVLQSYF